MEKKVAQHAQRVTGRQSGNPGRLLGALAILGMIAVLAAPAIGTAADAPRRPNIVIILGDDMGLGKTVQTMAAAELLARERGIERVLVVAPASVKYQWETEIRKFTDQPVQVIEGGHKARRAQYAHPTFYRLINYELVLRDLDELNAWQPDLIVLDVMLPDISGIEMSIITTSGVSRLVSSTACRPVTASPEISQSERVSSSARSPRRTTS